MGFRMKKWDVTFIRKYGTFHWLKEGEKITFPNGGMIFQGEVVICESENNN